MFLKHLGFFALPIANIGSLLPTAFAAAKPVILSCYVCHLNTSLILIDMICLVNIGKTTQTRRRCKYSEDSN